MGFATLYITSMRVEQILWLICFMAAAIAIRYYSEGKYFMQGLTVAILAWVLVTVIHMAFYPVYVAHHSEFRSLAGYKTLQQSRGVLVAMDAAKAVIMCLVAGAFAWVIGRGMRTR